MIVPKLVFIFGWLFLTGFVIFLLYYGANRDIPLTGWKLWVAKFFVKVWAYIVLLGFGYI